MLTATLPDGTKITATDTADLIKKLSDAKIKNPVLQYVFTGTNIKVEES